LKQVKEFEEANLLFGIMEKNVWGKANADTSGLLNYYNQHKSKYVWAASANAVIITCKTKELAEEIQTKLKENPASWRQITESYETEVVADSGRFELSQLPVIDRTIFTAGLFTAPVKNESEGTYTFNYVIDVFNEPGQRSFEDAQGMVISDYQQVLEDKWIAGLKKKYPVVVNQAVFQTIK
jgi:peptidyl-prolyl cis-trans isomerase SurA